MTTEPNKLRSGLMDLLLIAIFMVVLWLPLAKLMLASSSAGIAEGEKRKLTPLPPAPASWNSLWQYPDRFSAYYRDNFGFRSAFIRAHALVKHGLFHLSPSRCVLVGRQGWLYYADDYSLEDYRSLKPFTQPELARWKSVFEERQAWLAKRGIRFLIVLTCDKALIYPEFLPVGIKRRDGSFRIEELADYLTRNTNIPFVVLKSDLERTKRDGRIYHRTDSHWNDAGAYVGYREIISKLGQWFPQLRPRRLGDFTLREIESPGWDLAVMMGLEDIVHEQNCQLVPRVPQRFRVTEVDQPPRLDPKWNCGRIVTEVEDDRLPRAVILRDSFGSALVPFLAEHFRRCEFLWQYEFEAKHIRNPKPDVVILMMTSRRLQWYVPSNPELP
ncbi:MAG: hypothetical protein HY360_09155 [Verrucomicrobia bacterium]|nr:hypothetical protein [Verrucomicrobiota bacterium]